jgi:hypothetical protein
LIAKEKRRAVMQDMGKGQEALAETKAALKVWVWVRVRVRVRHRQDKQRQALTSLDKKRLALTRKD